MLYTRTIFDIISFGFITTETVHVLLILDFLIKFAIRYKTLLNNFHYNVCF